MAELLALDAMELLNDKINTVTLSMDPRAKASMTNAFDANCKSFSMERRCRTNDTANCGNITSQTPSEAMTANSVFGVMTSL